MYIKQLYFWDKTLFKVINKIDNSIKIAGLDSDNILSIQYLYEDHGFAAILIYFAKTP